jgi:phosphohistidine phosphatase
MDLILWRHAEAEEGYPDMARRLTVKGGKQAKTIAGWLNSHVPKEARVLVSPARRTQETAAALERDFITLDALAPDAPADAVLAAAGWPHADGTVLVVGHQPTLGEVAARLLQSATPSLSVKKGAAWWFTTPDNGETVILKSVLAPSSLAR